MRIKHSKYRLYRKKAHRFRNRLKKILKIPIYLISSMVIGLLILIFGLFIIFHHSAKVLIQPINDKIVIINHDGVVQKVPSSEPTVGALLKSLHIKIYHGDVVEPSLQTHIYQDDFRINIYRAKPIEIIENGQKRFVFSAAFSARAIAEQKGYHLYPEDIVAIKPVNNFLQSYSIGQQLIIKPAKLVYLNLYGNSLQIRTQANTVKQLLADENIKLHPNQKIEPSLNTSLVSGSQVFIIKHGIKISSTTQTIPMPVQVVYDNSLAFGTGAIRQQGSAGQEVLTYQEHTTNGVITSKNLLQTIVTVPAVPEIEVEGTNLTGLQADMAYAGIPPQDYYYASYIISHESGWCPTIAQGQYYCPLPSQANYMTSAGYGLCQATPGYKMASAGSDWAFNPITQLRWCNNYANSRYGGWYYAYNHWISYGNW